MTAATIHNEPFIHLVELSHDRALIAWGAFCFVRDDPDRRWEIVDDEQLRRIAGRHTCIGSSAEPFGHATVQVLDGEGAVAAEASTSDRCWVWVTGLTPATEYHYRVIIDGAEWAAGERCDWVPSSRGGYDLAPAGRAYDLRFTTWPSPDAATPPVKFAALGDYGVGIRSDSESSRRQRRIAEVLDKLVSTGEVQFVVSLGDNIYQGEQGQVDDESGGEDDDWYSSYFQPYRYVLARVPVYPAIGNHDTTDTEGADDRAQMEDNLHLGERFPVDKGANSAGAGLFYCIRYGRDLQLVCLDTSSDSSDRSVHRFFQDPDNQQWLDGVFDGSDVRWRIPFSHHPAFSAGPEHRNDEEIIQSLVPRFAHGGVRLALAGHEHNFQISEVDGRTYVVSGAGGKLREEVADGFEAAQTSGWAAQAHLVVVAIDGDEATLTPVSGLLPHGELHLMTALTPRNEILRPPFVITAS